jgi:hypothetical protein
MSDTEQSEAEAQSAFDQQIDISERFADLAAEVGAEYAAGRWELGNGKRFAVDYEPEAMWWGRGGFRMSMAHDPTLAWNRARRAHDRIEEAERRMDQTEEEGEGVLPDDDEPW